MTTNTTPETICDWLPEGGYPVCGCCGRYGCGSCLDNYDECPGCGGDGNFCGCLNCGCRIYGCAGCGCGDCPDCNGCGCQAPAVNGGNGYVILGDGGLVLAY